MKHDFMLIRLEHEPFPNKVGTNLFKTAAGADKHYEILDKEIVHDDVIGYFIEFLMFISSRNTWADGRDRGINRWGETVYYKDSAEPLITLLSGIKSIFLYAPESIKLRIYPFYVELEGGRIYDYEHFSLNKEKSLIKIDHLLEMAEYLRQPHHVIFHRGI